MLSFSINDFEDPFMRMISVLRFTFTKEAKFVVAFIPFYNEPHATYYNPSPSLIGIAWKSMQTLQLRSWRTFPGTLGRHTHRLFSRQTCSGRLYTTTSRTIHFRNRKFEESKELKERSQFYLETQEPLHCRYIPRWDQHRRSSFQFKPFKRHEE